LHTLHKLRVHGWLYKIRCCLIYHIYLTSNYFLYTRENGFIL
jgi:hypothetical protein